MHRAVHGLEAIAGPSIRRHLVRSSLGIAKGELVNITPQRHLHPGSQSLEQNFAKHHALRHRLDHSPPFQQPPILSFPLETINGILDERIGSV
jgi:hypothetical protein